MNSFALWNDILFITPQEHNCIVFWLHACISLVVLQSAVKRILGKMEGITAVETNVEEKIVTVTADGVTAEEMVEKLAKWSEASGKYVKVA